MRGSVKSVRRRRRRRGKLVRFIIASLRVVGRGSSFGVESRNFHLPDREE